MAEVNSNKLCWFPENRIFYVISRRVRRLNNCVGDGGTLGRDIDFDIGLRTPTGMPSNSTE